MLSAKNKNNLNRSFTIENNILKGVKNEVAVKEKSIGELVLNIFNDNPDNIGEIEVKTGIQTTFAEMKNNIISCALWMQKEGIKSGDVVGLCTHNQIDSYVPFLATNFTGAIINPWPHEITLKFAQYFMNLTRPKLMFVCENAIDILTKAAELENIDIKFIVFGKHGKTESLTDVLQSQTKEAVRNFEMPEIDPKSIALILFSSGTTGFPKAVQHSYEHFLTNMKQYLLNEKHKVYLGYSTFSWISGIFIMFRSILTISTRILHEKFEPEETCKCIEKFKVTFFKINKLMLIYLCKSNILTKYNFSSLEMLETGGSKISYDILEEIKKLTKIPATQKYGLTELGALVTTQTSDCRSIESVGFVVPNVELKIIDVNDNKKILGPNEVGEICIKSKSLMVGYLNNPKATKETIDDEGWLHSGDLAYYDENGEIFIVDRIKEVMKVAGHHVSPAELEDILMSHPGVLEAVVVGASHKIFTDIPVAFVKKNSNIEVTEDELIKMTSELGKYKTLSHVKFLDELPHTSSSKVDRKKAREMAKIFAE